jgi:hypothetical protein
MLAREGGSRHVGYNAAGLRTGSAAAAVNLSIAKSFRNSGFSVNFL